MSEWPLIYFVVEWLTISIPKSKGFWLIGLAKVLSQIVVTLCFFAIDAIFFKSVIFNSGFVGVSIQINLVLFLISLFKSTLL